MNYDLLGNEVNIFLLLFALGRSCVYLYQSQLNAKALYCIQTSEIWQLIIICYDNNTLFVVNSVRSCNLAI